ncbi:MAG: twin-arginine translocation signal domain-containing protein, partial [Xanthomonadales bacterium]|nr:twin-arginine translocation signal domain-containing protein [Xanthomonadales bacterium]
MTHINRRDFLKGCSVAALASGASGRAFAYFSAPGVMPA